MASEVKCWCQHCGRELDPSHTGKCPDCGETGKDCKVAISASVGIKASVSATRTRVYVEWGNKKISAIVLAIIIDAAIAVKITLVGLLIGGVTGAIVGFIVSLVAIVIFNVIFRRKVKTIIREITQYQ